MSGGRDEPGTPEQAPRRERRARGVAEGTVTVSVVSQSRDHVADLQVPAAVIAGPVREHLLHEMVKSQLASRRAGTAAKHPAQELFEARAATAAAGTPEAIGAEAETFEMRTATRAAALNWSRLDDGSR